MKYNTQRHFVAKARNWYIGLSEGFGTGMLNPLMQLDIKSKL